MQELAGEMSVEARRATLPNHQRPLGALHQRCTPAGGVVELKRWSQRVRGTRLYPGARDSSPRDRSSLRSSAPSGIYLYKRLDWRCCEGVSDQ